MTYQPKCVGKMVVLKLDDLSPKTVGQMVDFETLTLCISLNSSEIFIYICKELVTENCRYLVKNLILNRHSFSN